MCSMDSVLDGWLSRRGIRVSIPSLSVFVTVIIESLTENEFIVVVVVTSDWFGAPF